MVTINDIAAHSAVSTATVSHVVNNSATVTPELRERVFSAVWEFKYPPNAVARDLKTRQTKTVGMIIPDITNPFFPPAWFAALKMCCDRPDTASLLATLTVTVRKKRRTTTFTAQRVDGLLLIASVSMTRPEYLLHHDLRTTPIVFVDRYYRGVRGDIVLVDNVDGSFQAVSHLLQQGHRRIGIITGPLQLVNSRPRLEGYKRALHAHHARSDKDLIPEGRYNVQSGFEQTQALLSLKNQPTALFVSDAPMMLGCRRALRDCGVRCPEELAVVSFDDLAWFELAHPSMSAVAQNQNEPEAAAAQMLAKRLAGSMIGSPRRRILKTRLMI
jgi:LacI family transcriptional regulator